METNGIQSIVAASTVFTTWSLSLIGGSILAILSTEYSKPLGKWAKLIYLLFLPGWIFLGLTINAGDTISRRGVMAAIAPDRIPLIFEKMNQEFIRQIGFFHTGLFFLGLWLFLYLIWWIFQDFFIKPI
jgi:hypothetical protein